MSADELMKTCLHDSHIALGAQMSPFGGFDMPIQYSDIITEHKAVREKCGIFDVSHMGEIVVSGNDAQRFVNHIFTNDVSQASPGRILYGMLLNPQGGVVDDLLVYKREDDFFLVVNAANIAKDREWIKSFSGGFDVKISDLSGEFGEIALQGPDSERIALEALGLGLGDLEFYSFVETAWEGEYLLVSRTGYTGEDGFELYASHAAIVRMWNKLIEAGVCPCGLGCRDTLRFEVGLPLYGHELSDDISPLEAGLGIFVKLDKEEFVGKDAVAALKERGLSRKIVGIELDDKAIPRAGYAVEAAGVQIGEVTTGYNSISTGKSVCMALVDSAFSEKGKRVDVRIRKKVFPGTVCAKKFYRKNYKSK